jgi:hypothetical protein
MKIVLFPVPYNLFPEHRGNAALFISPSPARIYVRDIFFLDTRNYFGTLPCNNQPRFRVCCWLTLFTISSEQPGHEGNIVL